MRAIGYGMRARRWSAFQIDHASPTAPTRATSPPRSACRSRWDHQGRETLVSWSRPGVDARLLMDVPGRGVEGRVGAQANRNTFLLACACFHHRAHVLKHRRPGRHTGDAHDHVNHEVEVGVDLRIAKDLQGARWPLLVKYAQRNLWIARYGLRLRALGHRGDDDLRGLCVVVHDRHSRPVLRASVPKDRGAFASWGFSQKVRDAGLAPSMGRRRPL